MAREGRRIILSRREVTFGLSALPLVGCAAVGPDRDVAFIPANKAAALKPDDPKRLLELINLDPTIRLDMRYATANNFTGGVLYDEACAFLAAPRRACRRARQQSRASRWFRSNDLRCLPPVAHYQKTLGGHTPQSQERICCGPQKRVQTQSRLCRRLDLA